MTALLWYMIDNMVIDDSDNKNDNDNYLASLYDCFTVVYDW